MLYNIAHVTGNILSAQTQAIVIPVNTIAVAGTGLAKQAADSIPGWLEDYKQACTYLEVGSVTIYRVDEYHVVVSFPTKRDWRDPSKLEWIDAGLKALVKACHVEKIESIAIPMLGCGKGELAWEDVCPLIYKHFDGAPIHVAIYGPDVERN